MNNGTSVSLRSRLKNFFFIAEWLPKYERRFLGWDLLAGLTLASFVLPESMAYATLAGVPAEYGIYCVLAGGLLFALFTSAKQVVVGPTSAISLMVGSTIAVLAGGDPAHWAAIATLTGFVVFVLCLAAYFLKLSSLVSFISENILLGFKAGAALTIISTQLPKLFGVQLSGSNFFERTYSLFAHLPETNTYVLAFGLTAFSLLLLGNKLFPGRPVSLLVVIASILVMAYSGLAQHGFHMAGDIQQGLPPLGRPSLRFRDVDGILGLALGCFLMGYIETIAVANTMAQKHGYAVNPRQELLSLGFANLGSAFASGYPVSGGLSQSTVNDKAGARTPLALVFCSAALVVTLLYLTHLLEHLPEVMLAAVVLDAVLGLIKVKALKELWKLSKDEFGVAMISLVSVLAFGILKGVLIAAASSIAILIARSKMANLAVLGQVPGTNKFTDIKRNPGNTEIPGMKILRVESSIFYYNQEHILQLLRDQTLTTGVEVVVLDLSAAPSVDVAGARMLVNFATELKSKGIRIKIVEALGVVRDMLRKLGIDEVTGPIHRTTSILGEVEKFKTEDRR